MNTIEIIIKFLPFVGLLTFIKIVWEYIQSLKWKKSEFLAKEIKDFQNDPDTKIVYQILDWNVRKINIRGEDVIVSDEKLTEVLKTHGEKNNYELWEANLRDIFDKFFDRISTFQIYIESGLIHEKELFLYIGYYINLLEDTSRKPKKVIDAFRNYLHCYNYTNVESLIKSFKKYQ